MFSRFPEFPAPTVILMLILGLVSSCADPVSATDDDLATALRVCSDPNNMPFSNDRLEGFENKIAGLAASHMGRRLEYTWWAQRRGFIRNTLNAGLCDVVIGVPADYELTATTSPYYTSTYVFVSRKDRLLDVRSFDDERLKQLTIGVQLVGDDFATTPPGFFLSRRGIVNNVRGYTVYGDYSEPHPPSRIVEAVTRGDVDVAMVWGPLAGYFALQSKPPLHLQAPMDEATVDLPPLTYAIAMGVRRGDRALHNALESFLKNRRTEVDAILDDYGVPRVQTSRTRK